MNKVIISVCDDFTKQIIIHCVKAVNPKLEIIDGSNDTDIIYHLKSAEDDIVFFDKFFLGYVLSYKMKSLRVYNKKLRIVFCEQGNCSRFFGIRVYDLKADGFISHIENNREFADKLRLILSGQRIFPEEVMMSLKGNEHLRYSRYCSEITEQEFEIGLLLGLGKSIKEIAFITNLTTGTVASYISRLKNKIGFESMNDFFVLNGQMEKINIRSWNC